MASLQNQTSLNPTTFFFATKAAGEQDLYTSTITSGAFNDFFVGIDGGNLVQINQMPDVIGTSSVGGEEMLYAGTASTYKTLSSLSATAVGTSISIDRTAGSGITTIEAYAGNGSFGGYEFLSRGVNSALVSTPIDNYMKGIGREGATAVLGASGTLVAGGALITPVVTSLSDPDKTGAGSGVFSINDLSGVNSLARWSFYKFGNPTGADVGTNLALAAYNDAGTFIAPAMTLDRKTASVTQINQYDYPQGVITIPAVAESPGAITVPAETPTVLLTLSSALLQPGKLYLTDVNFSMVMAAPSSNESYLDLGVRLGGNGSFSYGNTTFVSGNGTAGKQVSFSLNQISDMGTSNDNIDIIAYVTNGGSNDITLTPAILSGGSDHYFKQIT
jgi:hypothetical protein